MLITLLVREVAEKRGIPSATALAELAGISHGSALSLMRGVSTRIDFAVLDRICAALDAQPGDLLQRVPNEKQEATP